jgi:PAS domain S-box-containing protein
MDVSIYERIFENIPDSIIVTNPYHQIIIANSAACSLFGLSKEEFYDLSLYKLVDHEHFRLKRLMEHRIPTGMTEEEIIFIRKDGIKFPGKVSSFLIDNKDGQQLKMLTIRKHSEKNKYEEGLREDLLRFQLAFDATYDGMWDLDVNTNQLYLSPNTLKMFGFEQFITINHQVIWNNIIHEKDKSFLVKQVLSVINGQADLVDAEIRVKMVTGVFKWIHVRGKAIVNAKDGSIFRIVGTLIDITPQKLNEEELHKMQIRFRSYFDNSTIGLAINTLDYSCIDLNRKLCQMLGFEKKELLKKSWTEVMHSDDIQPAIELIKNAIAGRIDFFKMDCRFIRKDNEILFVTLSSVCIRNDDGSIHHFLTSLVDR